MACHRRIARFPSLVFANVVKLDGHCHGRIEEIPKAKVRLMTEKSSIIRQLVSLQQRIDIVPVGDPSKVFPLEDYDVATVAKALIKHTEEWGRPTFVYPDERTNRLLVRTACEQMKAIRTFLAANFPAADAHSRKAHRVERR